MATTKPRPTAAKAATAITIKATLPEPTGAKPQHEIYTEAIKAALVAAAAQLGRSEKYMRLLRVHSHGRVYRFKVGIVGHAKG